MVKKYDNFYDVKVNTKNFDIVTGSKGFYQFLGKRLYYKFDMLTPSEEKIYFREKVITCNVGDGFAASMIGEDNSLHNMLFFVVGRDASETVTLRFGRILDLYDDVQDMETEIRDCKTLLAQLDCTYYVYNKEKDYVICFRFSPDLKVVSSMYVSDWYDEVKDCQSEEENFKVARFVSDIRNGIRNFRYTLSGEIFAEEGYTKEVIVSGNAIYTNGVHIKTVGSITNREGSVIGESIRRDQLTGLILKEDITNIAKERILNKKSTAIAIIDIDDFKNVNDNFGHMKGDEVLKRCAALIKDSVEGIGSAGRIGGDEFFIVMDYVDTDDGNENLRTVLRSLKNNIASTYLEESDGFKVTTSIGCAIYPKNVDDFENLFLLADWLLYRAKDKGKNRYVIYNGEKHGTVEDIISQHNSEKMGISARKGMAKSEIICNITDKVFAGEEYPVKSILNDIVDYFDVERITLFSKTNKKLVLQSGDKLLKPEVVKETIDYLEDEKLQAMYNDGVLVVNNIKAFEREAPTLYYKLKKQDVLSFMHHKIIGKTGEEFVLCYESVVVRNTWNAEDMHFFRILDHVLAKCL